MTYRALDLLTRGGYHPVVARREPFWRPRPAKAAQFVHLPAWDWESDTVGTPGDEMVDIDINAAFIAALSSGDFAHGAITRTGPAAFPKVQPGYYQILTPHWQMPSIVSPLGSARTGDAVWIMHPTYKLLRDLSEEGLLPYPEIIDTWTADTSCRLRKWAEKLRDDRLAVLATRYAAPAGSVARAAADKAYQDMKDSYSIAVQMMLGKESESGERVATKAPLLRPDWYHTVRAQHAATMWRKVWRAHEAGHLPFSMGSTDEVCYPADTWEAIGQMITPPFRIDPTGGAIGSFDVKDRWVLDA